MKLHNLYDLCRIVISVVKNKPYLVVASIAVFWLLCCLLENFLQSLLQNVEWSVTIEICSRK